MIVCVVIVLLLGTAWALSTDHDMTKGLSGRDIVQENMRQLCIFEQANATFTTDEAIKYWDYMEHFTDNCNSVKKFGADCSATSQNAVST